MPGLLNRGILIRASELMKSFMAGKTESYADTSAFIAFCDRSDIHHQEYLRLFAEPPPLVTSSLVVAEGHDWFLRATISNGRFSSLR
jgi:hypothetical protein